MAKYEFSLQLLTHYHEFDSLYFKPKLQLLVPQEQACSQDSNNLVKKIKTKAYAGLLYQEENKSSPFLLLPYYVLASNRNSICFHLFIHLIDLTKYLSVY